jgi:hypothetical protein
VASHSCLSEGYASAVVPSWSFELRRGRSVKSPLWRADRGLSISCPAWECSISTAAVVSASRSWGEGSKEGMMEGFWGGV